MGAKSLQWSSVEAIVAWAGPKNMNENRHRVMRVYVCMHVVYTHVVCICESVRVDSGASSLQCARMHTAILIGGACAFYGKV